VLGIKEHFWSVRLVQWAPIAGFVGLLRRSVAVAVLIGGWFTAYFFVKGSYAYSSVEDGSFFRLLMPAFPAFLIMCASIVFLVPRVPRTQPPLRTRDRRLAPFAVALALVVTAIVPAVAIAAASPEREPGVSAYLPQLAPVTGSLHVTATRTSGGTRVSWSAPSHQAAKVFFYVYRSRPGASASCTPSAGADTCVLTMNVAAITRARTWLDPHPGNSVYRVAVLANWLNDTHLGDVYLLSPLVRPRA
jgi:hypothetical protein